MSSAERVYPHRVSVEEFTHALRNGGNTTRNRMLTAHMLKHPQDFGLADENVNDLVSALGDAWRLKKDVRNSRLDTVKLEKQRVR